MKSHNISEYRPTHHQGIRDSAHFSLVVEHIKSLRRNKLTILDPRERLAVVRISIELQFLPYRVS